MSIMPKSVVLVTALCLQMVVYGTRLSPPIVRAEPVDTTALAGVRMGMSPAEVIERLGMPDVRDVVRGVFVRSSRCDGVCYEELIKEVWIYSGNSQVRDAVIVLENDRVTRAVRR